MPRIGHQEHRLYVAVEALIHRRHLELILEIRDGAQAAYDDAGIQFLGEMHQQAGKRPHLDVGVEPRHLGLEHLDPLGGREQRTLVVVLGDADDQPGTKQVAAGYAIYGPQTMLVLTLGHGVMGFTLDRELGSFVLTHENLRVPESTAEFAINMSNQRHWEEPVKRYVSELLAGKEGPLGKNYNMRWIASMVADVHRILTRGGIFMYPRDAREPEKPGKLRLMYEANPMSMIIEQAGGASTNGTQRILDIQPESLHQRVAVFLGSKEEVERVTGYHQA